MHLNDKMAELVYRLRYEGLNGVYFPDAYVEKAEMSGPDYAIAANVALHDSYDSPYFDASQMLSDLEQVVKGHFNEPGLTVKFHGWPNDVSEVEVYRNAREPG